MKKILLLCVVFGGLQLQLAAQQLTADKVPAVVLMAFNQYYPGAEKIKWSLYPDSAFGASFMMGKWRHFALCNAQGAWMQHCSYISYSEVPSPVQNAAATQFSGYDPMYASRYDTIGRPLTYELFLVKEKEFYVVKFSSGGEILANEGKKILQ